MAVYIIDDDQSAARTLARHVRRWSDEAEIFGSAEEFVAKLDTLPCGSVLLDIHMPGMSGLELIELLHARCPEWPVIMITGATEIEAAIRSFRHGAVHFLQKPFRAAELVGALEEAARVRERRQADAMRRRQALHVEKLTAREREILGALAKGHQGKTIAWEFGITARTVEMHRSNILAKLGARNTSQAVAFLQLSGES